MSQLVGWHSSPIDFALNGSFRWVARTVTVGVVLAANAALMIVAWQGLVFAPSPPPDWQGLVLAAERLGQSVDPYVAQELAYRWSPVAAWVAVPFMAGGLLVWQLLHLVALATLPRRMLVASLACFAVWVDVAMGNVLVFGFVLAYLAMTGKRSAVLAFTVFALLVPRPLYIPILLWLWLRQPEHRRLMVASGLAVAVLTVATGFVWSWVDVLASSSDEITNSTNMAPSRFIGYAWVPFGIAGTIWAFRRGWVGVASLLVSPYWLPYYFVMLLLDLRDRRGELAPSDSP